MIVVNGGYFLWNWVAKNLSPNCFAPMVRARIDRQERIELRKMD